MDHIINFSSYKEKDNILESGSILLFYSFIALSSIRDLGIITSIGVLALLVLCSLQRPRTGLIVLLSFFYLPTYQLRLPVPFLLASLIVVIFNLNVVSKKLGYKVNRQIIILYSVFLLLRFISLFFVNNEAAFWSYFFISFSVLIHILVISNLIENKEDIIYILKMWGVIGAFSAVLGYLHFILQDTAYLRQIYVSPSRFDKSIIEGTFDYVRWIWAGAEPNFTGMQLLVPFVINVFFFIKKRSLTYIILSLITFMGILGTYSRSSFIVSCVVIVLYSLYSGSLKSKLFFSVLVVFGFVLVIDYFTDFTERISTISEALNEKEASGRFPLYKEAIRNFLSNPIFGVGTGQTTSYSVFKLETHNLYLQSLGENGLFSFLVLVSIFLSYIKKSYFMQRETTLYLIAGIAIILNANTVSFFDLRSFFTLIILLNYDMYYKKIERYYKEVEVKNSVK